MWEGPSWLSEPQEVSVEQSPPTKWPRVTTPPNRRQSMQGLNDSGLGDSFCSPPLTQKRNMRVSPLRTPGSTKSSSTPFSPFGRFRLSSFSSPTMSDRALRLSNSENILDYKFCEEALEKNRGRVDIGKVALSCSAARSLNLPETKKEDDFEDIKPDPALLDMLGTPSKGFNIEDSGVFDESFTLFGSSPLKQLFLENFEEMQASTSGDLTVNCGTDPSAQKDDAEPMVKKLKVEEERKEANIKMDTTFPMPVFQPKRFIAPFSRRWYRYVSGQTKAQNEVSSAARQFLAQRRIPGRAVIPSGGSARW